MGFIVVGAKADVLLVKGDPLTDLSLLVEPEKNLAVIMKDGEFYKNTLSRSRFALCPSGTGPAIIRFLEALGSGAIPVVLSDNMVFPTIKGVNWEECCIKIAEKDYNTLRDVLSNISAEEENTMREKCLEAYKLSSGDNYVRNIRDYYER